MSPHLTPDDVKKIQACRAARKTARDTYRVQGGPRAYAVQLAEAGYGVNEIIARTMIDREIACMLVLGEVVL